MEKLVVLILAAGQASRFGSPKQQSQLGGKSLLQWTVQHAKKLTPHIIVVSGAYPKVVAQEVDNSVVLAHNPNWSSGMLSSIQTGVRQIQAHYSNAYCFILPVDMPWFSAAWLQTYVDAVQHQDSIAEANVLVATAYPEGAGLPALVPPDFAQKIVALPLDGKLRPVMKNYPGLRTVPSGAHTHDVDRPEDLDFAPPPKGTT